MERLKKLLKNKVLLAVTIAVIALAAVTTAVIAKYVTSSNVGSQTFSPFDYTALTVNEAMGIDPSTGMAYKSSVSVTVNNTGYPVFVRAAIVVSWQDAGGAVYGSPPTADLDYTLFALCSKVSTAKATATI